MRVLGISAFYHDSAAAVVEDGRIVAAAQEERFTRKKHDPSFPKNAIGYCLKEAGARLDELDHVVFYDKPFLKFERLMETYIGLGEERQDPTVLMRSSTECLWSTPVFGWPKMIP